MWTAKFQKLFSTGRTVKKKGTLAGAFRVFSGVTRSMSKSHRVVWAHATRPGRVFLVRKVGDAGIFEKVIGKSF
jgi:hypothetical protein